MLTGQLPFAGDNTAALIHSLLKGEARPVRQMRPGVPAAMARVLERLLLKDRERRFASARALIDELYSLAQTAPGEIDTRSLRSAAQAPGSRSSMDALLGTAERRTVTFLYMELAATAPNDDPEDFQTALEQSRQICSKIAERHQGSMQP